LVDNNSLSPLDELSEIRVFLAPPNSRHVHVLIKRSSVGDPCEFPYGTYGGEDFGAHSYLTECTERAVKRLEQNHAEFFEDGDREGPREMKDLDSKLFNKRHGIFNVSRYRDHLG
jgi:hypothetical protein